MQPDMGRNMEAFKHNKNQRLIITYYQPPVFRISVKKIILIIFIILTANYNIEYFTDYDMIRIIYNFVIK